MRLFIATRIDAPSALRIERGFAGVRSRAARASWVSRHAYHLTFAFLGEQDEAAAIGITRALPGAVEGLPRYEGALSGGGFFPDDRRPKVGWLALEEPGTLMALAASVRRTLDGLGISYDRKAFRPHLTVVRIRNRWSGRDVAEFRRASEEIGRIKLILDRVILFRSELRPEGARHDELAAATLA